MGSLIGRQFSDVVWNAVSGHSYRVYLGYNLGAVL